MSNVDELEERMEREKRRVLKEKYKLEEELEQIQQDKFSYKRKGDMPALDKAVMREREIKNKLNSLKTVIPNIEIQVKSQIKKEKEEKARFERIKKEKQKQKETKNQMGNVLRLMKQGKTRSQAAQQVGIPLSRISHWISEGKQGIGQDNIDFYNEITSIEKNQEMERKKRQEKEKQERDRKRREQEKQERERKRREQEKEERERKKRQEKEKQDKTQIGGYSDVQIKEKMDIIIQKMKSGKTRDEAATYAGVSISTVNEWFDLGWNRKGQMYTNFYNKVNKIEINQVKTNKQNSSKSKTSSNKSSTLKKCPKCGKWYKDKKQCPHCSTSNETSKINYCQNCGTKVDSGDVYCSNCGNSLKEESTSTSSSSDSNTWAVCCIAIIIIFILVAIGIL